MEIPAEIIYQQYELVVVVDVETAYIHDVRDCLLRFDLVGEAGLSLSIMCARQVKIRFKTDQNQI